MKLLVPIILAFSLSARAQVMNQTKENLYLGSYNIYTFGTHGEVQIMNAARVLASGSFDLVALQEVMDEKGEAAVAKLTKLLKDSFQLNYASLVSKNIGEGYGGQERVAFLYKAERISPVKYNNEFVQIVDVPMDGRDFVFSHWKMGNFDFVLGSGHLYYAHKSDKSITMKRRLAELKMVYSFFNDPKQDFGDEDLIFVGDFNRAAKFNDFKEVKYDTTKYFIPNVEFFDPGLKKYAQVKPECITGKNVPNDDPKLVSTTVAEKNTYVYDMIICSKSLLDNYNAKRNNGVFNSDFGVISYDQEKGIGTISDAVKETDGNKLKAKYSDHRPVWVKLKVN